MALTFNRDFTIAYGEPAEVAPGLRRVVAQNPSPFTFKGTGTYILGRGEVALVDAGPPFEAHVDALLRALEGETITHLITTHTHGDHSPAARLIKERTGALIVGCGRHPVVPDIDVNDDIEELAEAEREAAKAAAKKADEQQMARSDDEHVPDIEMHHGDRIEGSGWTIEALHTPGHISNHLCFAVPSHDLMFSGDHVMGWSTTVITPPTGDLNAYMDSLQLLLDLPALPMWPTHGPCITEPHEFVAGLAEHRRGRTRQILSSLAAGPKLIREIVDEHYVGLEDQLVKAARRSVLSHLIALVATGDVTFESLSGRDYPSIGAIYRLA
ncbi:MAG: MBL fold metallo-hydrolase [Acidimicrobiia bacterium]